MALQELQQLKKELELLLKTLRQQTDPKVRRVLQSRAVGIIENLNRGLAHV